MTGCKRLAWAAGAVLALLGVLVGYWGLTGNALWSDWSQSDSMTEEDGVYAARLTEPGRWQLLGSDLRALQDNRQLTCVLQQKGAGPTQIRILREDGSDWLSPPLQEGDSCLLPTGVLLETTEVCLLAPEGAPPDRGWSVTYRAEPAPEPSALPE